MTNFISSNKDGSALTSAQAYAIAKERNGSVVKLTNGHPAVLIKPQGQPVRPYEKRTRKTEAVPVEGIVTMPQEVLSSYRFSQSSAYVEAQRVADVEGVAYANPSDSGKRWQVSTRPKGERAVMFKAHTIDPEPEALDELAHNIGSNHAATKAQKAVRTLQAQFDKAVHIEQRMATACESAFILCLSEAPNHREQWARRFDHIKSCHAWYEAQQEIERTGQELQRVFRFELIERLLDSSPEDGDNVLQTLTTIQARRAKAFLRTKESSQAELIKAPDFSKAAWRKLASKGLIRHRWHKMALKDAILRITGAGMYGKFRKPAFIVVAKNVKRGDWWLFQDKSLKHSRIFDADMIVRPSTCQLGYWIERLKTPEHVPTWSVNVYLGQQHATTTVRALSAANAQKAVLSALAGARGLSVPLEDIEEADADALSDTPYDTIEAFTEDSANEEVLEYID
jgi:hypothetical protein